MEIMVNTAEKPQADEMRDFLKSLPEQSRQYILGCVDIARLFSTKPAEADASVAVEGK